MERVDHYSLKNAPRRFKIISTVAILASVCLLAWSWYISLTLLRIHRPSNMCVLLGDDLWALAHNKMGLFIWLYIVQAFAYAVIFLISRLLFQRAALRRYVKSLLLSAAAGLVVLDQIIWLTAPFIRLSQQAAGYIGLASAIVLIAMTLPPLYQMWFYKRWRNSRPTRVVIVGGGFAGMYAALGLDQSLGYHRHLEIILIDQKNFFLFPPLLPSASVGTIETRQVTQSYRRIFETTNIQYKKATVTGIDLKVQAVKMHVHLKNEDMQAAVSDIVLPYDYLILAPGSTSQTFNTKGALENALFLKELGDAVRVRDHIIDCFERAAVLAGDPKSEGVVRELLQFAVVGGGPTGVEIATEIHDLIHEVLLKRYPEINGDYPGVVIIQSGPQILPGWPAKIVETTTRQLKHLGIQLILNSRVTEVRPSAVVLKDGPAVPARTILWCAGVQPSPLLKACGLPLDPSGRVSVDEYLRAPGRENVFVLGDSALSTDSASNKPLPPLGQVAFQQGDHTAKNLACLLRGKPLRPFKYFNYGALVSVGERYAAVDLMGVKLTGFIGWFVWRSLYLTKMIGVSTKIRIMTDWTLDLVIERSIAQLTDMPHDSHESNAIR